MYINRRINMSDRDGLMAGLEGILAFLAGCL
jgi:hypothetical protein